MANPYPEGSPLSYIEEAVRSYDEMVADPRHPYHQPCERESVPDECEWPSCSIEHITHRCKTHDRLWGECGVKAG